MSKNKHHHHHHHHHFKSHHILIWAVLLILAFAIIEAGSGWFANSLALLSDAGHMASDAVALLIAAFAAWIAHRPPSAKHTYGLGRAEIVAAWLSSLMMILISIMVIIEAIKRLHHPQPVQSDIVIIIAFLGLLLNLLVAWMLGKGQRTLNIRAALLHVMSDMLGSIAALVAGAIIHYTNWLLIDPILSIVIGILIMISSIELLRESLLILMEGVPQHIDVNIVNNMMLTINGVKAVHDLHIWTLSSGNIALSAHIDIHELSRWQDILHNLMKMLKNQFAIDHVTLQPEPDIIDCQPCHR